MKDSSSAKELAFLSEPRFGEVYLNIVTLETGHKKIRLTPAHLSTLVSDGAKMLRPYAEERA